MISYLAVNILVVGLADMRDYVRIPADCKFFNFLETFFSMNEKSSDSQVLLKRIKKLDELIGLTEIELIYNNLSKCVMSSNFLPNFRYVDIFPGNRFEKNPKNLPRTKLLARFCLISPKQKIMRDPRCTSYIRLPFKRDQFEFVQVI